MIRMVRSMQMVVIWGLTLLAVISSAQAQFKRSNQGLKQSGEYVDRQVIVKLTDDATAAKTDAFRNSVRAKVLKKFPSIGAELWQLSSGTVEQAVARYHQDPRIKYIEPNYKVSLIQDRTARTPNDPLLFPQMWGLHNTGQTGGKPDADIDAPEAWDLETGNTVVVGVIDTGVDWLHEDLAANIWINAGEIPNNSIDDDRNGYIDDVRGWDFVNNDNNPMDDNGHGTHVSGTIAAVGNNGVGTTGVSWSAKIMGLKFLSAGGNGTTADAILAVEYATQMGARLTNNSWGGGEFSQALYDAIAAAGRAGILFIAAAGNDPRDNEIAPHWPSSYDLDNIIAVAATDHNDNKAWFSAWGAISVDLGAPGVNILSTVPGNAYDGTYSGTSMATPHVSGAVCLLWSRVPGLSHLRIKDILLQTVDPVPDLQGPFPTVSGGRLNAFEALRIADPDSIPPARVTDLAAIEPKSNFITLTWTARGDDGDSGRAAAYDIRYSTSPIDANSFAAATRVPGVPAPKPAGDPESFAVGGLNFNTTYYFALKVIDEQGNASEVSNSPSATTLGIPEIVVTPDSLADTLLTGAKSNHTLLISNDAEGTLDFSIAITGADSLAVSAQINSFTLSRARQNSGEVEQRESHQAEYEAYKNGASAGLSSPAQPVANPNMLKLYRRFLATVADSTVIFQDNMESGENGWSHYSTHSNRIDQWVQTKNRANSGATSWQVAQHNFEGSEALQSPTIDLTGYENATLAFMHWHNFDDCGDQSFEPDGGILEVSSDGGAKWTQIFPLGGYPYILDNNCLNPIAGYQAYSHDGGNGNAFIPALFDLSAYAGNQILLRWQTGWDCGNCALNEGWYVDDVTVYSTSFIGWLSANPLTGTVAAGDTMAINVTFDATGLNGGNYAARLAISSNDPNNSSNFIPTRLQVIGAPDIALSHTAFDFGSILRGDTAAVELKVSNLGTDVLTAKFVSDNNAYTVFPDSVRLNPKKSQMIQIRFIPAQLGEILGALMITSNDVDELEITVPLRGESLPPPEIAVSPDSLRKNLFTGQISKQVLTIANSGGSNLTFDISFENLKEPPIVTLTVRGPEADSMSQIDSSAVKHSAGAKRLIRLPIESVREQLAQYARQAVSGINLNPAAFTENQSVSALDPQTAERFHAQLQPYSQFVAQLNAVSALPSIAVAGSYSSNMLFLLLGNPDLVKNFTFTDVGDGFDLARIQTFSGLIVAENDISISLIEAQAMSGFYKMRKPILMGMDDLDDNGQLVQNELFPVFGISGAFDGDFVFGSLNPNNPITKGLTRVESYGGDNDYYQLQGADWIFADPQNRYFGISYQGTSRTALLGEALPAVWSGGTNNAMLIANAINWVMLGGNAGWVSVDTTSGLVPPGSQAELEVIFNAAALRGGDYTADLVVTSNDPDEKRTIVPMRLGVTGAPDIAVEKDTLDFGQVFIGTTSPLKLKLQNTGSTDLLILSANTGNTAYTVSPAYAGVDPAGEEIFTVGFAPQSAGDFTSTLTFKNNDPDEAEVTVTLLGKGVNPPEIAVSPDSLRDNLLTGQISKQVLTIANSGGGNLTFDISFENLKEPPIVTLTVRGPEADSMSQIDSSAVKHSAGAKRLIRLPIESVREQLAQYARQAVSGINLNPAAFTENQSVSALDPQTAERFHAQLQPYSQFVAQLNAVSALPSIAVAGSYSSNMLFLLLGNPDLVKNFTFTDVGDGFDLARIQTFSGLIVAENDASISLIEAQAMSGFYKMRKPILMGMDDLDDNGQLVQNELFPVFGISAAFDGDFVFGSLNPNNPITKGLTRVESYGGDNDYYQLQGADWIFADPQNRYFGISYQGTSRTALLGEALPAVWSGGTNNAMLIANAINWVMLGGNAGWVSVDTTSGLVPPGSQAELEVIFNAAALRGGDYTADLVVTSNDPDEKRTIVPVRLGVTGAPDIAVEKDTLDFGQVFIGTTSPLKLKLQNTGSTDLLILSANTGNTAYTVSPAYAGVDPAGEEIFTVGFAPQSAGDFTSTLTFKNNDPDEAEVTVTLLGKGIIPPEIVVMPDSLFADLKTGETETQIMKISNNGGSDLIFNISIESTPKAASAGKVNPTRHPDDKVIVRTDLAPEETADGITVAPPQTAQAVKLPFYDGFESGNFNQWVDDGGIGVKEATRTTSVTGKYSFHYRYSGAFNDHFHGIHQDFEVDSQPEYIGFYIRSGSTTTEDAYFVLTTNQGSTDVIWFYARDNGFLYINDNVGGDNTYPYQALQWYHIEFKNIDWTAKNFDYYVDGALVQADIPFRNASFVNGVDRLYLYNFTANSEAWWDDIAVGEQPVSWLTATPISGIVPPDSSIEIQVKFDPAGLNGGDYFANVVITNNDPRADTLKVPTHLHVTGAPVIAVSPDTLDYSPVFVGYSAIDTLIVSNKGTAVLEISAIVSDLPEFAVNITKFVLQPGEEQAVQVVFTPSTPSVFAGQLAIISNDSTKQDLKVALLGIGLISPDIAVSPDSLRANLFTGADTTQILTISNSGGSDLIWQATPAFASSSTVVSTSPTFHSSSATASEKTVATTPPARPASKDLFVFGSRQDGFNQHRGISPHSQAPTSLEEVLKNLNEDFSAVTGTIPNRFDFFGGDFGNSIDDGGNDMYDGGNFLSTNLGGPLFYFDSTIVNSPIFGSGGRYFTRKYPGLFVLAADMAGVNAFEISGGLGADGAGNVDGAVLETVLFGTTYQGFVKRVYHAGDPSVNHLIIIENNQAANHEFSTDTNNDFHRVFNLSVTTRLYYLLYAGDAGFYIDNPAALNIMNAFLQALDLIPQWLTVMPDSGRIAAGSSVEVGVKFNATGLPGGDYKANLRLSSNDPDERLVPVPAHLRVIGAPVIAVSDTMLSFGEVFVGVTAIDTLIISNNGTDSLMVSSIASDNPDYSMRSASFTLAPGEGRAVEVSFTPSAAGQRNGALTIVSNDKVAPQLQVTLAGEGVEPPVIAVTPAAFEFRINEGDSVTAVMKIANTGGSPLNFMIGDEESPQAAADDQKLYWTESSGAFSDTLHRSNLDGTNVEAVFTINNGGGFTGIAVDEQGGRIYWADFIQRTIRSSNLDGSDARVLIPNVSVPVEIAIDHAAGKMYWTDFSEGAIYRANLDGSGAGVVVRSAAGAGARKFSRADIFRDHSVERRSDENALLSTPWGIALDLTRGKMYWTEQDGHRISRANLDGSGVETIINFGLSGPRGIKVDTDAGKIYFVDSFNNAIKRANLNGGNVETLVTSAGALALNLDLDTEAQQFYWTDIVANQIKRANFDGSNVQVIINPTRANAPFGIGLSLGTGWLTEAPTSGTVAAGASQDIQIKVDPSKLTIGDHSANILIESNDPQRKVVTVPVNLHVTSGDLLIAIGDTLRGAPNETVAVPVYLTLNEDSLAVAALGATIKATNKILTFVDFTPGAIIPDTSLRIISPTPDSVRLAFLAANGQSITQSGLLATIRFQIANNAPVGQTALLNFNLLTAADSSAKPLSLVADNGMLRVNKAPTVSGQVQYAGTGAAKPVANLTAKLTQNGSLVREAQTDAPGNYMLANIIPGTNYRVQVGRATGGIGAAITPTDALMALRASLSGAQKLAADVDGNLAVESKDAMMIFDFFLGLISQFPVEAWRAFPANYDIDVTPEAWKIAPDGIAYPVLRTDLANQDYLAVVRGDVDLDWPPSAAASSQSLARLAESSANNSGALLQITATNAVVVAGAKAMTWQVRLDGAALQQGVYAFGVELNYDASALEIKQVRWGKLVPVEGLRLNYRIFPAAQPDKEKSETTALTGRLRFGGFSTTAAAIHEAGVLIEIDAQLRADLAAGASLPIRLSEVSAAVGVSPNLSKSNGAGSFTGATIAVVDGAVQVIAIPTDFALLSNYPNPFNPATRIHYELPEAATVKLEIFNALGQKVRTLVNSEQQAAGYYKLEWNGRNDAEIIVPSGIYFYRFEAKGGAKTFAKTRKMLMVK